MALETDISDHHKTIMTIYRSIFAKSKPKTFISVTKSSIRIVLNGAQGKIKRDFHS